MPPGPLSCCSSPRIIRFRIISNNPVTMIATVRIESKPVDGFVPGAYLAPDPDFPDETGLLVDVRDPSRCFLNEPNDCLVGRFGFAVYLDPSLNSGYPESDPQWEVFSLCCPVPACGMS